MLIEEAIRTKRAVRLFTPDPLPADVEREIFEAGRRAQSSKNSQPWQFIAVHDRALLQQLSTAGMYAGHLAGAALGVVLVEDLSGHDFDLGQAAAYMQLAAWGRGVGSCIATIYFPDQVRTLLGIPPEMKINFAISFGYPQPQPPAPARPPIVRRPLDDIVHQERW